MCWCLPRRCACAPASPRIHAVGAGMTNALLTTSPVVLSAGRCWFQWRLAGDGRVMVATPEGDVLVFTEAMRLRASQPTHPRGWGWDDERVVDDVASRAKRG